MSSRVQIDDPDERQMWTEGREDRAQLARDAGWGTVSWRSVFVGVLTAIGAFAVCVGAASAILHATGMTTDTLSTSEWTRLGLIAGIATAVALLGSFAFGGYAAGRMARRSGVRQGLLVFLVGIVVIVGALGIAQLEGALAALRDRLDELGAPTGDSAWGGIALLTICAAAGGSLLGSIIGAVRGERWHQRLVARAMDPDVGPEADRRAEVEAQREAMARALARADQEGETEVTQELPPGMKRDRDRDRDGNRDRDRDGDREDEPASTAAGPRRTPSSPSSGP
jgi:hypothetical protein